MGRSAFYEVIKDYFKNKSDIIAIYLYGSFAKGLERKSSDVDLAAVFLQKNQAKAFSAIFTYEEELSAKLGRKVEIQNLSNAPLSFVHRVLKEGKLIASNNNRRRVMFEEDSIKRYFDMRPLMDEYYKSLSEIARKGELHVRYA